MLRYCQGNSGFVPFSCVSVCGENWKHCHSLDENGVDSGYGRYESKNDAIRLDITYWTSANKSSASNTNHTSMNATFDGQDLTLEDGRRFQVLP